MTTIKEYTERAENVIREALENAGFKAEVSYFTGVCLHRDGGGETEVTVRLELEDLFIQTELNGQSVENI